MGLLYEKQRTGTENEMPAIKEAGIKRAPVRGSIQVDEDWDEEVDVLEDDSEVNGVLADDLDTEDYEDELM